ncbi:hypothetical protein BV898_11616 [Hypsibius exemplaris]|uniref:ACB domain-containing protein n=1 Tax=Hypsibius exemplaris TaxID=2072580 RepID=A0A1W0WG37_HYPEX|nr:hypothetical protein BV898_11616 [Hypsibius exemplaris]
MDPDYCQNPVPVYAMGGSAAAVSLFFLLLSQMKTHKQNPSVYYHGFGLFFLIGVSVCARQFLKGRHDVVEDIYKDIMKNAKEIDRDDKTHLSALISQAMHGDMTSESISQQVLGWSKALAGFGNTQQAKMKAWSEMKGTSKSSATSALRERACKIIAQINKMRNP